jgi:hypothetical protein
MRTFYNSVGLGIQKHQTRSSPCNNVLRAKPGSRFDYRYVGFYIGVERERPQNMEGSIASDSVTASVRRRIDVEFAVAALIRLVRRGQRAAPSRKKGLDAVIAILKPLLACSTSSRLAG